ncbi:hypothetical protein NDU88_005529 [Pleurodeles waltl]|uniref:Uncharacterized protein n=1 Tax=Pleurodeles waltl TaxID=8319 RepID=A0AAV7NPA2_PLEWA|nr:hypothetical protein NDU88_005529 [Pleurodeles waltl]
MVAPRDDHHRLVERVTSTERELTEVPPAINEMTTCLTNMDTMTWALEIHAKDAENRKGPPNAGTAAAPWGATVASSGETPIH